MTVATIRRTGLRLVFRGRPNRTRRYLSAVFREFVERGEWSSRDELKRYFGQTGAVEFYKSLPRPGARLIRMDEGLVQLSVEALSRVDGAQRFLAQFVAALHIAAEQYQDLSDKPLLSADMLMTEIPGVDELRAKCLMRVLEGEGLMKRATPEARHGILTARLLRYVGVEDLGQYLAERRGLIRGRGLKRVCAYLRDVVARVADPDSGLPVKLATGGVLVVVGLIVGAVSGLLPG